MSYYENYLDDKDSIYYLLIIIKEFEKEYCSKMMNVDHILLYQIYKKMLLDISELQRMIYYVLFLNGWYLLKSMEEWQLKEKYYLLFQQYLIT